MGSYPVSIAVGDFNRDGALDLVVAHNTSVGTVSVILGNGDGTFQAARSFGAGTYPFPVAVRDFNGDGVLDFVVAHTVSASNNVSVLLGNGDGSFQEARSFSAGWTPFFVTVGDLNGDGVLDLALANPSSPGSISVLLGSGDGSFQVARSFGAGAWLFSVTVGDFYGNGALDLVVTNFGSNDVSILINNTRR